MGRVSVNVGECRRCPVPGGRGVGKQMLSRVVAARGNLIDLYISIFVIVYVPM